MSVEDRIWTTKDGRKIHVERMAVTHIWNTMLMLRRNIDTREGGEHGCYDGYDEIADAACSECDVFAATQARREAFIEMFEVELLRRGLTTEIDHAVLKKANDMYEAAQVKAGDIKQ